MLARNLWLALSAIGGIIFVFAILTNTQPVVLHLNPGAWTSEVPLSFILCASLALGSAIGHSISLVKQVKTQEEKRKLEWQAQDAKLAAEVKSDREKQLEAKIATLETALQRALKKT